MRYLHFKMDICNFHSIIKLSYKMEIFRFLYLTLCWLSSQYDNIIAYTLTFTASEIPKLLRVVFPIFRNAILICCRSLNLLSMVTSSNTMFWLFLITVLMLLGFTPRKSRWSRRSGQECTRVDLICNKQQIRNIKHNRKQFLQTGASTFPSSGQSTSWCHMMQSL